MGVASKHAYRFGFLKSDKWKNLRLACLARDKGRCVICNTYSLQNDAHHLTYPPNWYDTELSHLRTLCRTCHESVHELIDERPDLRWKSIKTRINPPGQPVKMTGRLLFMFNRDKMMSERKRLTVFIAWLLHRYLKKYSVDKFRESA